MSTVLRELCEEGWTVVDPPRLSDPDSVIARYRDEPIKAGILMKQKECKDDVTRACYRSGTYNIEILVDSSIGRGKLKVEQADGYN